MIEVLKQALEALEVEDLACRYEKEQTPEHIVKAITSLRQAITELESQESNPIKDGWKLSVANGHSGYGVYAHMEEHPEEGAFLLLSIKELESQEPVSALSQHGETGRFRVTTPDSITDCDAQWFKVGDLYTHPPQRTWVGLTDEEIEDLYFDKFSMGELKAFAQAIEAKLKERNG